MRQTGSDHLEKLASNLTSFCYPNKIENSELAVPLPSPGYVD